MHAYRKDSERLSGANRVCGIRVPAWMSLSFTHQPEKPVLSLPNDN